MHQTALLGILHSMVSFVFLLSHGALGAKRSISKATLPKLPKRLPTALSKKEPSLVAEEKAMASKFMAFLDVSPEPFHVVDTVSKRLQNQGFVALDEAMPWGDVVRAGGKYYYTRNKSSIVAFVVGGKYVPGNGFKVIGAHTDSPNLKIKPNSKRSSSGLCQLNVECYGGGLWHTWFDRDLSIAGRVIVRNGALFQHRLVKIDRSILRVPNLCIHFRPADERDIFKINKEDHLSPILCAEAEKALGKSNNEEKDTAEDVDQWTAGQQSELLSVIADELKCDSADICDFELSLYDTQKAAFSGSKDEFICGSRIDNLASCFVAIEALGEYTSVEKNVKNDEDVSIVALFDHEEVGSSSNAGAGSPIMRDAVVRITEAMGGTEGSELFKIALAKSLILSVDMAHAVHPNYASKHDAAHAPKMNHGVVIKSNANQRYATNGITGFFTREIARRSGVPIQEFAVRNDCPCGSTIGPIISSNTGIRAVDLGMPQLSMHSIREMMGVSDLMFANKLFRVFFEEYRTIDSSLKIE